MTDTGTDTDIDSAKGFLGETGGRPTTPLGRWIRRFEIGLISVIFTVVVIIGLTQIGLRNFADSSLVWADPAMRAGVLWLAMLSAGLAAAQGRHIRIDVLSRKLPDHIRPWVARVLYFATALICLALTAASMNLLQLEIQIDDIAFLNVPRWLVLSIMPVGFALMAWRFMRHALGLSRAPETRT